jgi:hypothetical protein
MADAAYGDILYFLTTQEARQGRHVLGVCADSWVSHQRKATNPARRVDRLLQALLRWQWRTLQWQQGGKGWLRKKFVAVRCRRATRKGQRQVGWLMGERVTRGQPEERKYRWSNLSAAATLEELAGYAHKGYATEQFHAEAKGEVGSNQSQGRWPSFRQHAVTVMLAYNFLVWLKLRQRHGSRGCPQPRDPFSSSPGPTAADAASSPS